MKPKDKKTLMNLGKMAGANVVDQHVSRFSSKLAGCFFIIIFPIAGFLLYGVYLLVKTFHLPQGFMIVSFVVIILGSIIVIGLIGNKIRSSFWKRIRKR